MDRFAQRRSQLRRLLRQQELKSLLVTNFTNVTYLTGFTGDDSYLLLFDKGEVLVKENCARCHAVGKQGDSPHKQAPPFRTLSENYPIEDLAESLAEGIVSGHPDMPIFAFSPQDVEAIILYLESIQEQPAPSSGEPG